MLIVKSFHIIAFTAWFAGLLYLPRLFVYHADCEDLVGKERFMSMEKKLYWYIMLPAMLMTVLLGLMLIGYGVAIGGWLAVKLLLVAGVLVFHGTLFFYMRRLAGGRHPSARFFRLYNEIPTVLLIGIVLLAVVKPF